MRTAIEEGTAYNVPVVDGIINAVNIYTQAKSRNQTVQEYTDQASLLEQYPAFDVYLAQFIENNKRSGKQIRTMLNNLYDQVQEYGDPQQESIFGGEEHGLQETLERAISRYESEPAGRSGAPTSDDISKTEKWLREVESKASSSRDPMLEILAGAGKRTLETMKAESRKG